MVIKKGVNIWIDNTSVNYQSILLKFKLTFLFKLAASLMAEPFISYNSVNMKQDLSNRQNKINF